MLDVVLDLFFVLELFGNGGLLGDNLLGRRRLLGLCCFLRLLVVGCGLCSGMYRLVVCGGSDWLVSLGSGFMSSRLSVFHWHSMLRLRGLRGFQLVYRDFSVRGLNNRGVADHRWGYSMMNWSCCVVNWSSLVSWSGVVSWGSLVGWSSVVSRSSMLNWSSMVSWSSMLD